MERFGFRRIYANGRFLHILRYSSLRRLMEQCNYLHHVFRLIERLYGGKRAKPPV
jgi:hypothetical protein